MELIQPPRVVARPEIPYLGLRLVTPFRGMLGKRDELLRELIEWLGRNEVADAGPFFLRLVVIDMDGDMEIEVGAVTPEPRDGDDRVSAGVLPAGRYATLTYRDHALRANRALLEWAKAGEVALDRWNDPAGDRFACRYEAYLTDPRTEPRKTKWEVELNIRTR
ncbi:MAG TPA: GyrI-like domain-containing protein [Candidatus Limnocylindrales bacterium]